MNQMSTPMCRAHPIQAHPLRSLDCQNRHPARRSVSATQKDRRKPLPPWAPSDSTCHPRTGFRGSWQSRAEALRRGCRRRDQCAYQRCSRNQTSTRGFVSAGCPPSCCAAACLAPSLQVHCILQAHQTAPAKQAHSCAAKNLGYYALSGAGPRLLSRPLLSLCAQCLLRWGRPRGAATGIADLDTAIFEHPVCDRCASALWHTRQERCTPCTAACEKLSRGFPSSRSRPPCAHASCAGPVYAAER
mmetsp:Transcript_104959/g.169047  ORF Transcript_104959/g.169047 Transcript_104959/m.169047 type:complete len:245 (-) Transcript_104959:1246-1980(-)